MKLPLRTLIVMSDEPLVEPFLKAIREDPRFRCVGCYTSLTEAYSPTESAVPDLVICSKAIAAQPEFAMYDALVGLAGGRLLTTSSGTGPAGIARALGLPGTAPRPGAPGPHAGSMNDSQKLVAIGTSTGGIGALSRILSQFPQYCPPTIVVQHIKPEFLDRVVERLNAATLAEVVAATGDLLLLPGRVILAPGLPRHLEVQPGPLRCILRDGPAMSGHRPSVDRLFLSAACLRTNAVGVILTGMGRDGALGLGAMRNAGAWTIAQDEATSTVFGMPRAADEIGAACEVLPLPLIGTAILAAARRSREHAQ